ncbi:hypothetical protein [Alishewanella sp. HL-SH06]|uniref:hypothetical protein n=1 Tax=Alishewanella sp. HL-SH06 TaxID=3461144 RepID=UPI004040F64E
MAKVLRKRVFECGDVSAARVTFSPWTTIEQLGFRAEVGSHFLWILSFGDAKESISPTAKTLRILVSEPEANRAKSVASASKSILKNVDSALGNLAKSASTAGAESTALVTDINEALDKMREKRSISDA